MLDTAQSLGLLPGHELLPYGVMLDPNEGVLLLETPAQQRSWWQTEQVALGCAWQVEPRNCETLSESACLDLARAHAHLLRSLPVGSALQVLTTFLPAHHAPGWEHLQDARPRDALWHAQQDAIRAGMVHHIAGRRRRLREVRTLVTVRLPCPELTPTQARRLAGILGFPGTAPRDILARVRQGLHTALRDLQIVRQTVDQGLRTAGHTAQRLDGHALGQAIAEALAPDQVPLVPILNQTQALRRQVLARSLAQQAGGVVCDPEGEAMHARLLTLHHNPPATYPGMLTTTRVPDKTEPLALWEAWEGPVTVAVNIAITSSRASETRRQLKFLLAKKGGAGGAENAAIVKELDSLETAAFTQHLQTLWGRVHVTLWGADADAVAAGLTHVMTRAAQLHFPLAQDGGAVGSTLWLQTLPLGFDPDWPTSFALQRECEMPLEHWANLVGLYGCWRGHAEGPLLLLNSRGEPALFDPAQHSTNRHVAVAGTSGGGKTYTFASLIHQVVPLGASALVLDPLSNYRRLCEVHAGTFLHLNYETPPCFNPFFGSRREDHQAFATGFLAECASGGQTALSVEEFNVLGSAITYHLIGWDPARGEPTLTPFCEDVLMDGCFALKDSVARDLGKQIARKLLMYYGGLPYAKFVDGPNTFTLKPGLTLIEFSAFEKAESLQGIVFLALAHQAQQFFTDPLRFFMPKYFLADEVWKWLQHPATAKLVGDIIRTYRNLNTSAWFTSQRLEDFNTATGQVILSLTGTKVFLKHETNELAAVKTLFELSDAEVLLVSQAARHEDCTRGFLRIGPGEGGLVHLVSDHFTRLMLTQRVEVAKRREQLIEEHEGQVHAAIAHMLAEGWTA